jgi:N-acetylglucosaminyldiphosphoundecaprenol N-acetyl-beta-D-mannosaminyltransferase
VRKIKFFTADSRHTAQSVISCATQGNPKNVNLFNAYSLASAEKSRNYEPYVVKTSLNLFDGFLVALAYRILNKNSSVQETRGVDLFRNILHLDQNRQLRHFFICGSTEIEHRLRVVLANQYSGIHISGVWIPSENFSPEEFNRGVSSHLASSKSNIIWVGLGTPKQDRLSLLITKSTNVTTVGIGAALEFFTGIKAECPGYIQRMNLEWLYRLVHEPSRLWKRYSIDMFFFIRALANNHFTKNTEFDEQL